MILVHTASLLRIFYIKYFTTLVERIEVKKAIILNEKDTGQNYVSSANELTLAVESGNTAVFS